MSIYRKKDKNGVEIYEGDILELDIDDVNLAEKNRIYVAWCEESAGYIFRSLNNDNIVVVFWNDVQNAWKVIGNKYEE